MKRGKDQMPRRRSKSNLPQLGDEAQVKCWIATAGHLWMDYYDLLPARVRQRLRELPVNLCPACLVTEFLPKVQQRYPGYRREQALMAGIDMMLAELKKGE